MKKTRKALHYAFSGQVVYVVLSSVMSQTAKVRLYDNSTDRLVTLVAITILLGHPSTMAQGNEQHVLQLCSRKDAMRRKAGKYVALYTGSDRTVF